MATILSGYEGEPDLHHLQVLDVLLREHSLTRAARTLNVTQPALSKTLARLRRYFAEFGDIYRVFAPGRGVYNYVINHPDDIKRVLLSNHRNYTKGEGMDRVKILLGNGIMTSEGDFWKRQRYMMQPMFHRRVVTEFARTIDEVNDHGIVCDGTKQTIEPMSTRRRVRRTRF